MGVCNGMDNKGFLHNDLKLDNIVIGNTMSLSDTERDVYKREHSQIAPDLRDGLVAQSILTDVYSLGRIIKSCNSVFLHSAKLSPFIKQILSYHSKIARI